MATEEAKVVIPESVLKKRKREEEWALAKKSAAEAKKKKDRENRKLIFTRAQQYSKEYESQVFNARCCDFDFDLSTVLFCIKNWILMCKNGFFFIIFILVGERDDPFEAGG